MRSTLVGLVAVMGLSGCGDTNSGSSPTSAVASIESPAENVAVDVFAQPAIDDRYKIAAGQEVALRCWGEGAPAVILEGGHPVPEGSIQSFEGYGRLLVEELAASTTVCAYDRPGTGLSDPAPRRPRSADDVVRDLHAVLRASPLKDPYVLVGSSFGGMIVTYYAATYPADVEGVVLLDVPAPSASLSLEEAPELAWDDPTNPEHVDVVPEFENRFANDPVSFDAPLVVVTATQGQSSVKDQRYWVLLSHNGRQVELEGGHDIWADAPGEVAAEILSLVESGV